MDVGQHGNNNEAGESGLSHLRWRLSQVASYDLRIEGYFCRVVNCSSPYLAEHFRSMDYALVPPDGIRSKGR